MKATAFCDGRGNAGIEGACAAVIYLSDGKIIEKAHVLGEVTNNVAEYEGVLLTMRTALEYGVTSLKINSDSQVIVNQLCGNYEARNENLLLLRNKAWEVAKKFECVNIFWISRNENKRSDGLCREVSKKNREKDSLADVFSSPFSGLSSATT